MTVGPPLFEKMSFLLQKPGHHNRSPTLILLVVACLASVVNVSAHFLEETQRVISSTQSSLADDSTERPTERLLQQQTSCPAKAFSVTTALYIVSSASDADIANTLPSCLGQTQCQVQVAASESCVSSIQLRANSVVDTARNCTAGGQPVYSCKGLVVSPELYTAATSGQCVDDWQQSSVQCPGALLQRAIYQGIVTGKCSPDCASGKDAQQMLSTQGSAQCKRLSLRFSASNFAEAVKLRQATDTLALDALNTCWSNGGNPWQALAMEQSGPLPQFPTTDMLFRAYDHLNMQLPPRSSCVVFQASGRHRCTQDWNNCRHPTALVNQVTVL